MKLNLKLKKRYLVSASIAMVLMLTITSIVLGVTWGYVAEISVQDMGGTARTGIIAIVDDIEGDNLIDAGFVNQYCTDIDLQEGTTSRDFMPCDDKLMMYIPALSAYQEKDFDFYMDYDPAQTVFPVILGEGGYITTSDSSAIELGDDFVIDFQGYIDASPCFEPIVESVASSIESTQVTSHDVSFPDGVEVNDLIIAVTTFSDPEDNLHTITFPSDLTTWALLDSDELRIDEDFIIIRYCIATGNEGSTFTITTNTDCFSCHQTFRISNYSDEPEALLYEQYDPVTTPNPPELASTFSLTRSENVLWIACYGGAGSNDVTVNSYPTNYDYSQRLTKTGSVDNYINVASAYRDTTKTTTENPGSFTISGAMRCSSGTIGIKGHNPGILSKQDVIDFCMDDDQDLHVRLYDCLFTEYFYTEGVEDVAWITGYSLGTGSQNKESNHLYLCPYDIAGDAERTYVTSSTIDWSNLDTLYVDWANNGSGTSNIESHCIVDDQQMQGSFWYNSRNLNYGTFSRQTESQSVSTITGSEYLRVHARDDNPGDSGEYPELLIYNLYATGTEDFHLIASDLTTGIQKIELYIDGGYIKLDVNGVNKDSDPWDHAVLDNSNSWVFGLSYFDYLEINPVGGSGILYEPTEMIDGTTMPDLNTPSSQDGTITWGTQSDDITVTIGTTTAFEDLVPPSSTEVEGGGGLVPTPQSPSDWYPSGNVTGLPFFDMMQHIPGQFNVAAQGIGMPTHSLYLMILVAIAVACGFGVMLFTGSLVISTIITGIVIAGGVSAGIVGWWMVFVFVIIAVGTLYLARAS